MDAGGVYTEEVAFAIGFQFDETPQSAVGAH
jgi:hypothetical protein